MSMPKPLCMILCGLVLLVAACGCRTNMYVNFGNGTIAKVQVESLDSRKRIEVRPGHFKKLPHASGQLLVEPTDRRKFTFTDVSAYHVDPKYSETHGSIFGFSSATITVLLKTNMQLYALIPGEKTLDTKVEQPEGYPKLAKEAN